MEKTINKTSLQDAFLDALRKEHIQVSIYISNGTRFVGNIETYDAYLVLLKSNDDILHPIYKHSISTVLPSRSVNPLFNNPAPQITIKKRPSMRLKSTATAEV
ncbi:MAG: RNA chaperone Hfq [Pseudomonadota bacterium]